jgi:CO/xanthine dehydrogenase Mo-binding subunit
MIPYLLMRCWWKIPLRWVPLGIRGVGEPPIVPGGAAVANAVREVTGVRFEQLPIRPQALWKAMNS